MNRGDIEQIQLVIRQAAVTNPSIIRQLAPAIHHGTDNHPPGIRATCKLPPVCPHPIIYNIADEIRREEDRVGMQALLRESMRLNTLQHDGYSEDATFDMLARAVRHATAYIDASGFTRVPVDVVVGPLIHGFLNRDSRLAHGALLETTLRGGRIRHCPAILTDDERDRQVDRMLFIGRSSDSDPGWWIECNDVVLWEIQPGISHVLVATEGFTVVVANPALIWQVQDIDMRPQVQPIAWRPGGLYPEDLMGGA